MYTLLWMPKVKQKIGPWVLSSFGNTTDFMIMKSGGFHGKDLYICIGSDEKYSLLVVDHEIRQISCMKSSRFHEIWRIS